MSATPPDGYAVPKPVTDLLEYAKAHGWKTLVQWAPADGTNGGPYVNIQIGRRATEADWTGFYQGSHWLYDLTYHSRGCEPGKVRKFGVGLAQTPDHPKAHGAPSLKAIREVIAANPRP